MQDTCRGQSAAIHVCTASQILDNTEIGSQHESILPPNPSHPTTFRLQAPVTGYGRSVIQQVDSMLCQPNNVSALIYHYVLHLMWRQY